MNPYDLSAALYDTGYRVEHEAFTERVIVRAFERTGVWPFNPERILENTCLNIGLESKQSKAAHIQTMKRSVQSILTPPTKKKEIKQGTAKIQASTLFSPFELLEAEKLTVLEKQNKERKKTVSYTHLTLPTILLV